MLKLDGVHWCSDEAKLRLEDINYFVDLFTKDEEVLPQYLVTGKFPRMSPSEIQQLDSEVTIDEFKRAVFDMGLNKASGSDRLNAYFFQHQWHIVAILLLNLCRKLLLMVVS